MADAIHLDKITGEHAAYFADSPAWHYLGQVVEGARSWQEVMNIAHMNWTVSKRQLEYQGKLINAWGIFRDDTMDFINTVGERYTPIQNEYAFNLVDTLLEAENGAHYESAGVLFNGSRIWTMARVPFDFSVGPNGDEHKTYLLFASSHDGSLASTCKLTTVRVVCNNTLQRALRMNGTAFKVKHTKDAEKRLEAAKKLMKNAVQGVASLKEKLEFLGQRMLNKDTYVKVLDRLFPSKEGETSTRRDNILLKITELFEKNDGDAFPEHRGTAFNLLNAITEYTDHERGVRITKGRDGVNEVQARAESSIFGSGNQFKEEALEVLMEESANCLHRPYATYITRAIESGKEERGENGSLIESIIDNMV